MFQTWQHAVVLITLAVVVSVVTRHMWKTNYPPVARSVRWSVPAFRGGDLLLTSNENMLTCTLGGSYWNHIAVVYQEPETGLLYAWEVCNPPVGWSAFVGTRAHRSTRLSPLARFFERWSRRGGVAYRPLVGPPVDAHKFSDFVRSRWGQGFAYDYIAQGANRFFGVFGTVPVEARTTQSPRYCAELAAETYEALGVLDFKDSAYTPHQTVPKDFSQAEDNVPMAATYRFGPETYLVRPKRNLNTITLEDIQ